MIKLEHLAELMSQRGLSWTSKLVGLVAAILFGSLGMVGAHFIFDATNSLWLQISVGLVFALVGYAVWVLTCQIPKNKTGYIGIGLAIKAETEDERKRIRSDFVSEIAGALNRAEAAQPFCVVEIPSYLAPAANDVKGALEFLRKSKCHLLIWGGIKTRKQSKKNVYCLKLEGVVTHSLIAIEQSRILAQEMRLSIPQKTEIALANELKGFESASNSLVLATKYIVALASALSGDLNLSKTLLLELEKEIPKRKSAKKRGISAKKTDVSLVGRLAAVLPRRLADVYFVEYFSLVLQWQKDRDNLELLNAAERSLEMYLVYEKQLNGEGPQYWISKALLEVSLRNSFEGAQKLLLQCKMRAIHDPVWRLSLAFVKTIQGKYAEALQLYDDALKLDIHAQTIFDIEDYVQWWLAKHNGPAPLFLLSALLNAKAKTDLELAIHDLERFEELMKYEQNTNEKLISRAAILKSELDAHIQGVVSI